MIYKGLKGIACTETTISNIDGDKGELIYRGYDAKELAGNHSFEEVAHLLWYGHLPDQNELEALTKKLASKRELPAYITEVIKQLPEHVDMMSVMRTAISALGSRSFPWKPTVEQAISLTALLPSVIGYRLAQLENRIFTYPEASLGHVAYYLFMLSGKIPSTTHTHALEAYFILTMEHGLNASTFSARVTASTESDMVSALVSAIGTMKGPLHGGAPTGVLQLLEHASGGADMKQMITDKVNNGERIMGFGHRVYKTYDPRAMALKLKVKQLAGQDSWLDLAMQLEEDAVRVLEVLKPGRSLYTNVEFYAAAIMKTLNMDPALFTPTFTSSRIVGWTTHIIEQASDNVIFRPSSVYVGQ